MKSLKDFITESSIITEGKNECELIDVGQVGAVSPKVQKVQISPDAKFMEISMKNFEFINFYNDDDIYDITEENEADANLFKSLNVGQSKITTSDTILVRIAK